MSITNESYSHLEDSLNDFETNPGFSKAAPTMPRSTSSAGTDPLGLVEGALSVLLAGIVVFAPVVKIPFVGSYSLLEVVSNLSKLNMSSESENMGTALIALTIIVSLCSLINAKRAFSAGNSGKGASVLGLLAGAVPAYALFLTNFLSEVSQQSYSVVSATEWVHYLLIGGIACVGIHIVRYSRRAKVQRGNLQGVNAA